MPTNRSRFTISAPSDQVEKWKSEASESFGGKGAKSKYGRQMMEAGRRELGLEDTYSDDQTTSPKEPTSEPEVPDLEYRVVQQLDEEESQTLEEIVEGVTEGIQSDVEQVLNDLIASRRAEIAGGGYKRSE